MKLVELTQGKFAAISDEDAELVEQFKWYAAYEADRTWVAATHPNKYKPVIKMHRLILGVIHTNDQVDHINGRMFDKNTINNMRTNLRLCNNSENNCNRPKYSKPCSSQYKGVSWDASRQKWMAYVNKNGKRLNLGRFADEVEAALAYNDAATQLHGEFALLNVVAV